MPVKELLKPKAEKAKAASERSHDQTPFEAARADLEHVQIYRVKGDPLALAMAQARTRKGRR